MRGINLKMTKNKVASYRNRIGFLIVVAVLMTLLALIINTLTFNPTNSAEGQSRTNFPQFEFTQKVVRGATTTSVLTIGHEGADSVTAAWYFASNPVNGSCPSKAHLEQDHYKASSVDATSITISGVNNYNQNARYCILAVPTASDDYNYRIGHYQVSVPTVTVDYSNQQVTVESRVGSSLVSHPSYGSMHKYYWSDSDDICSVNSHGTSDTEFDSRGTYSSLTSNPGTIVASHTNADKYLCVRGEYKTNTKTTVYVFKKARIDLRAPTVSLGRDSSAKQGLANNLIVATASATVSDWQYIYGPNVAGCDQDAFDSHNVNSQNPTNGQGTGDTFNIADANPAVDATTGICFKAKNSSSVWGYSTSNQKVIKESNDFIDVEVKQVPHLTNNLVDGSRMGYVKNSLSPDLTFQFNLQTSDVTCDNSLTYTDATNWDQDKILTVWSAATDSSYLCVEVSTTCSDCDKTYYKIDLDLEGPTITASKTSSELPTTITAASADSDLQKDSFQHQYRLNNNQLLTGVNDCSDQISNWHNGSSVRQPEDIASNVKIVCFRVHDKSGNWSYSGQTISQIAVKSTTPAPTPAPTPTPSPTLQISVTKTGSVISYSTNKTGTVWYYSKGQYASVSECRNLTVWSQGQIGTNHQNGIYCIRGLANNQQDYQIFNNFDPSLVSNTTIEIQKFYNSIYLTTQPVSQGVTWSSIGPFKTEPTVDQCSYKDYSLGVYLNRINSQSQDGWYCYRATLANGQEAYKPFFHYYVTRKSPTLSVKQEANKIVYTVDKSIKQWLYAGPLANKPSSCHNVTANKTGKLEKLNSRNDNGWYCFLVRDYEGRFAKPAQAVQLSYKTVNVASPELYFSQNGQTIVVIAVNKIGKIEWRYHFSDDIACSVNNSTVFYINSPKLTVDDTSDNNGNWLCVSATDADGGSVSNVSYRTRSRVPEINFTIDQNKLKARVNGNVTSSQWRYKFASSTTGCSDLTNDWQTTVTSGNKLSINLINYRDGDYVCVRVKVNNNNQWGSNNYQVSSQDDQDDDSQPTPTLPSISIKQVNNQLIATVDDDSAVNWKVLVYTKAPSKCNADNQYFETSRATTSNVVQLSQSSVGRHYCFKATNSAGSDYQVYNVTSVDQPDETDRPIKDSQSSTKKKVATATKKTTTTTQKKTTPKTDEVNQQGADTKDPTTTDQKPETADETKTDQEATTVTTEETDKEDQQDDNNKEADTNKSLWSRDNLVWWIIAAGGVIILAIIVIEIIHASTKNSLDEDDEIDIPEEDQPAEKTESPKPEDKK